MAAGFEGLNAAFSSRVQALISASGGLLKPGSGFRDIKAQEQLRIANGCPDLYKSPASSCRIPTAIPGRSNHNHGLAMDLVDAQTGKAVQAGSAADRWLASNAQRFGLHRPVGAPGKKGWEPWHVEPVDDDEMGDVIRGAMRVGGIGTDQSWMDESRTPEDELNDRLAQIQAVLTGGSENAQQAGAGNLNRAQEPEPEIPTEPGMEVTPAAGGFPAVEPGLGAIPPPGYEPPGKGVARWRPVVIQALRYTGQPVNEATIALALRRMKQESGGNPRAINKWDSNAKKGDPTQGLMQHIPSAWNGRAKELAARGINDGFANIVASIRYTLGRYGSLQKGWGKKGGY